MGRLISALNFKKAAKMNNILENKKFQVKLIPEKVNNEFVAIDANHVGKYIFPTCMVKFTLPISEQAKGYKKIFSNDEIAQLETLLSRNTGELSFYKSIDNFWDTFTVSLDENPLLLDLTNPMDIIRYRVIQVQSFVSPTWDNRFDSSEYRWAIIEEGEEIKEVVKTSDLKMKAFIYLDKIKDDKIKMLNLFKVMGKYYPEESNRELLYFDLCNIIETKKTVSGLLSINDFLNATEDKNSSIKAFIQDLKFIGEISIGKNSFKLKDGTVIGNNVDDVIYYFNRPENSELKTTLEIKLKNTKK